MILSSATHLAGTGIAVWIGLGIPVAIILQRATRRTFSEDEHCQFTTEQERAQAAMALARAKAMHPSGQCNRNRRRTDVSA